MKTIEERLSVLERTQWILTAVIVGHTGIEVVPWLIAILL